MSEYIFYTTEGYTQSPKGEDLENCQLLGSAHGSDSHKAMLALLKSNPWITEHGFNPKNILFKELSPIADAEETLSFLTSLLDKKQLELYQNWIKAGK